MTKRENSSIKRVERWRAAKKEAGLKEIRNLWINPADEAIVRAFAGDSDEERLAAMRKFCFGCGTDLRGGLRCYCQNDE